ncbi:hypothetical protein BUALT_Bualt03G0001600 [Buddleja alternifolia]|uniref:RING-type domain-containing protein n=1 Tax=Buddleja alternifolia TaxID=168488 RepID=A0AAV6XXC4_9LAMI|nr:hypothetical protein BUALT_Bualt03G0001600 [Buddleja alternifolia]
MASSQVEIATSSPFDRCFQNNFNNLVTSSSRIPNANANNNHIDYTDLWVHSPQAQTTTTTATECNIINNNNDGLKIEPQPHNHNDKWARAREMMFSVDQRSRGSVEVQNMGGVSSLVQKWRGFEAEAKCSSNRGTFQDNNNDNNNNNAGPKSPSPVTTTNGDDAFGDWESDRTTFNGPTSYRSRDSDATERERLRVSDIIRKLKVGCESPPPRVKTTSSPDQSEQRCFSPVAAVSSPRIRGRQAYNDLLMQMERDRKNELQGLGARKAVSKFSHRGRIQALLRFRFLRRGIEAEENQRHSNVGLVHFRERVSNDPIHSPKHMLSNTPAEPNLNVANLQAKQNKHQYSCPRIVGTDHVQDEECSITSRDGGDVIDNPSSHQLNKNNVQQNMTPLLHSSDHEINPFMSLESSNHSLDEFAGTDTTDDIHSVETAKFLHNIEINTHTKDEEASKQQEVTGTNYELTDYCTDKGDYSNNETYLVSDVSHTEVGWEELQSDYDEQQEEVGSNREWIDEVSRPRSDWEGLRQARYQEMLDPFSDNQEIRSLLARRSVSGFLSSGLREQIDRVMISRSQGEQSVKNNHIDRREKEKVGVGVVVREDDQLEEEREDYYDDYEEAERSMRGQYNECDDYIDQNTSSPPARAWPQEQGEQVWDYSSQLESPSIQQSLSSNSYSPDNAPNSSSCTASHIPAIEMELIYDLRGHMEQLRQEISELRKSIKCCMNMQNKIQRSIKKEVATALNHSDGRRKKVGSGGRCCVCCKMQVDSLLYRCGHMCTCFKCAHELLQWGSGKCPICRAPIMDVVRTNS